MPLPKYAYFKDRIVPYDEAKVGLLTHALNYGTAIFDGIRGYWTERDVAFDAALMKAGTNVLKLAISGGNITSGVEYDYLRLELDEAGSVAVK